MKKTILLSITLLLLPIVLKAQKKDYTSYGAVGWSEGFSERRKTRMFFIRREKSKEGLFDSNENDSRKG